MAPRQLAILRCNFCPPVPSVPTSVHVVGIGRLYDAPSRRSGNRSDKAGPRSCKSRDGVLSEYALEALERVDADHIAPVATIPTLISRLAITDRDGTKERTHGKNGDGSHVGAVPAHCRKNDRDRIVEYACRVGHPTRPGHGKRATGHRRTNTLVKHRRT